MFNRSSKEKMCPLIKKPCLEHGCEWYMQILGTHPQTGEQMNQSGCSMVMMPILMIENSQQQRQTGAAVESFRNEMVKANEQSVKLLAATQHNLLEGSR